MQAVVLLALLLIAGAPAPCRGCDAEEGDTRKRACTSTFVKESPRLRVPLAQGEKAIFCCHAETLRRCVQRGYARAGCESEGAAFPALLRAVVWRVAAVDCDEHVGHCAAPLGVSAAPSDVSNAAPPETSPSDARQPPVSRGAPAPSASGRVRGSAARAGGAWWPLLVPLLLLLPLP